MAIFDDFRRSSTISWFRASGQQQQQQQQQQQPYIFSMKLLTVSFSQLVVRAIDEIWLIFARLIEKGWCSRDWSRKVDYDKPFDGEILAVFQELISFSGLFSLPMRLLDCLNGDIHAIFSGKQLINSMTSTSLNVTPFFSTDVCLCGQPMDKKTNNRRRFLMKM